MSTPLYDFFTRCESAWDAWSMFSLGASSTLDSIYDASTLAPSSRTASIHHLYIPFPPREADPPIHDIPLSPSPSPSRGSTDMDVSVSDLQFLGDLHISTVNSLALPLSRTASIKSDVSVSNVAYLGRLHLCTVDSLAERRALRAAKGGKVKRAVRKVRETLAKVWVEMRRTEDV